MQFHYIHILLLLLLLLHIPRQANQPLSAVDGILPNEENTRFLGTHNVQYSESYVYWTVHHLDS